MTVLEHDKYGDMWNVLWQSITVDAGVLGLVLLVLVVLMETVLRCTDACIRDKYLFPNVCNGYVRTEGI